MWQRFRQLFEEKVNFIGKVVEAIPVGLRIEAFGKMGFMPFSHFPFVRTPSAPAPLRLPAALLRCCRNGVGSTLM